MDEQESLRLVNPELFAKYRYLTRVDVKEMFTKSDEVMQPILLSLRRELLNDPSIDMEGINRKVLQAFFQSDGEDLIQEQQLQPPGGQPTPNLQTNQPNKVAATLGNVQ